MGCSSTAVIQKHARPIVRKTPEQANSKKGRRGWKKCSCQIFASGTLAGKFKRQCTDNWEWDKAEKLVEEWQKAGSWPSRSKPPVSVPAPEARLSDVAASQASRKVIREVTEAYLSACESRKIKGSTQAKFKTLTNQLEAYCSDKG